MTANAFDDDRARCMAAGMNDFIPKPIETPVLIAALDRWVGAAQTGVQGAAG